MLRIISGLLLLIISQLSLASVSQSLSTASAVKITALWHVSSPYFGAGSTDVVTACKQYNGVHSGYTYTYVSNNGSQCIYNLGGFTSVQSLYSVTLSPPLYSCSSGYLSDSSGVASSSGQFCTTSSSVDSCLSYKDQKTYLWVSKTNVPSTVCDGTCTATVTNYSNFPTADPLSYQGVYYTYTGQTGSCTDVNTGWVDESTATAANAAAAQREADAKLKAAQDACGSQGYIIDKLVTGPQSVICNSAFANLPSGALPTYDPTTPTTVTNSTSGSVSSATSTNPDGTTTTTTTSTTTSSNDSSTGTNGGSTTTTTTTVVRNPDGTVKSSTETATGFGDFPGLGADYKYADSKRNDWGSRNFSTVISDNVTKLKGTNLYGAVTGFFNVSFSGSSSPSNFNATYQGTNLSASFDWAANLAPFQGYIRAVVMFVCCYVAFKRCIE